MPESSGGWSSSPRSTTHSSTAKEARTATLTSCPACQSLPRSMTAVGIYLIRVCGLSTPSSPIPRVGLGGLVPRTESAASGGLPFTSADFCDFRTHGPRMKIDDLSAPPGSFVARVSASVAAVDRCPGRGGLCLQPKTISLRFWPYPPRSARAPQKPGCRDDPLPADSFFKEFYTGTDSVETTGLTVSAPVSPGSPAPPTAKPPSDRISTRTR